jgi:general secretion pathway protein B
VSLILDALNRSRQDENPVPGLGTHHPVDSNQPDWRQYLVWVALAGALVGIAWMMLERFSAPPVPAADIGAPVAELSSNISSAVTSVTTELKARAAASATQAVVAEQLPAVVVTGSPAEITEPVTAAATLPVQIPEPAVAIPSEPNSPQDSAETAVQTIKTPSVRAAENAAVAELYQNRELQKDPVMPQPASRADSRPAQEKARDAAAENSRVTSAEQTVDIDQILQQAREEIENASLDDHAVPFLADLSQQTKDAIPTLYYQRHDYSSDVNISSIVLNGTPLKVGGSPEPGMKVEEILPDSVVLNYQGTQFRLRALNSWINL